MGSIIFGNGLRASQNISWAEGLWFERDGGELQDRDGTDGAGGG